MSVRDHVLQSIAELDEAELERVASYVEFLKSRARAQVVPAHDASQLASVYAEFAEEDRRLAEEGMAEYADGLASEDQQ
jgi:hypothetical protein